MKDLELKSILLLIVAVATIVLGLKFIFTAISNSYIKKNKERLFDDHNILANRCRDLGLRLLEQIPSYHKYIKGLRLNRTYSCSSSVVSNASNNIVKYLIKYSNIENTLKEVPLSCSFWMVVLFSKVICLFLLIKIPPEMMPGETAIFV